MKEKYAITIYIEPAMSDRLTKFCKENRKSKSKAVKFLMSKKLLEIELEEKNETLAKKHSAEWQKIKAVWESQIDFYAETDAPTFLS